MDPNAAWKDIADALNATGEDWTVEVETIEEEAIALKNWIDGGGFLPNAFTAAGLSRPGALRLLRAIEEFVG